MKIAIVAPPFIPVPPPRYGGTELFIAQLACGLTEHGVEVVVYTNGESTIDVEKRWIFAEAQWPLRGEVHDNLKDIRHTAWAVSDAFEEADVIHLNNTPGLVHSIFPGAPPFVHTIHHEQQPELTSFYSAFPGVHYVTISDFQRERECMPRIRTIHHGVDGSQYQFKDSGQGYFSFIGRIAPVKGTHLAVQVAQKTGIPLKIAGEVQPMHREYFDTQVKPHIDGKLIEYIGEADLAAKNELLGNSIAMLFPIQWNEPFGLVMIESMMCGTPVLALPGGAVGEVIKNEVSGFVYSSIDEMSGNALSDIQRLKRRSVRTYAEQFFSVERMVQNYIDLYADVLADRTEAVQQVVPFNRAVA